MRSITDRVVKLKSFKRWTYSSLGLGLFMQFDDNKTAALFFKLIQVLNVNLWQNKQKVFCFFVYLCTDVCADQQIVLLLRYISTVPTGPHVDGRSNSG